MTSIAIICIHYLILFYMFCYDVSDLEEWKHWLKLFIFLYFNNDYEVRYI